jgi:hypothetical protein
MTAGERLLDYLPHWPDGVTVISAAPFLRASATTLYASARRLERDGLVAIGTLGRDAQMIVCLKHFEPGMLARIEQEKAARIEQSRRTRNENNRRYKNNSRLRATEATRPQDEDDKPFVHRSVSANQVKPLPKRGVASVWEFAELAS